jgi:internalin A
LTSLNLNANGITGATNFSGFGALTFLGLSDNPLGVAPTLTGLLNLNNLSVSNAGLPSLAGLGLPSLQRLEVLGNPATDLSPLATATNLQSLSVGGTVDTQPTDLTALSKLTQLTSLQLFQVKPTSLAPLAKLTQLTSLSISSTKLGANGLTGIDDLPLTYLYVYQTDLADLTPIASLTKLATLYLYYSEYTDISPLLANSGIGTGDYVYLYYGKFDCAASATDIAALKATGAGVYSACP